jgi:OmcA/MtrC family decaheme c-type cytochrome
MCHVPNLSSSGRGANAANVTADMAATSASLTADGYTLLDPTTYPEDTENFKEMIHGIHAGSSRTDPYKIVAAYRTGSATYFSAAAFTFPGILKRCDQCHSNTASYTTIPVGAQVTTNVTSDGTALTLANNIAAVGTARTSLPNANDLVTTPFTASCVSCHDLPSSVVHMKQNGGQIRVLRSTAVPGNESCVTCHGSTGTASIFNAHRY